MTDLNATAVVVDSLQLVVMEDADTARALLHSAEVDHLQLQQTALNVMAFILGGNDTSERFGEFRRRVLELAADVGADDRQVVLSLETLGAAQAIAEGNFDRANVIVTGSTMVPFDSAWAAVCLSGQAVLGWVRPDEVTVFFRELRRHYRVGDAA
ncbi:hypothetical protein BH10ACT9_BH10ACT9_58160 [soil metagenome]